MQKNAAEYARLVPSVRWLEPAEALRRQPLLRPEAAAGGAIFEPEADDMDVAAIHGGFLRARAPRAPSCGSMPRSSTSSVATTCGGSACATAERSPPPTSSTPSGAWADIVGGTGRRAAHRPGA